MKQVMLLLIIVLSLVACVQSKGNALPTDPLSIAEACIAVESMDDMNTISSLLADDIVYEQIPPGIRIEGKDKALSMFEQDIVFGHKRSLIGQPEVDGERVTMRAKVTGDDFKIIGIDHIKATYAMIIREGKVNSISVMIDSENWAEVEEKTGGGLGINIEFVKQGVRIKGFAEQSPAKEAGMQIGDIVSGIDGMSCDKMESWEIVIRVRGPVGSKVNLTVMREDIDTPIDIVVTRVQLN